MRPPRFWPKQAAALALFNKGACDTETNVIVLVRGVVVVPDQDDKLLELLFQSPPRIPRSDEPTIPIPLPTVSGSTPLDVDSHFARV